jgi:hypothetical protein
MKYLGTLSLLLTLALLVSTFPNKVAAQTSGPFQQERVKLLVKGMDPDEAMADQAKLILTLIFRNRTSR